MTKLKYDFPVKLSIYDSDKWKITPTLKCNGYIHTPQHRLALLKS